MERSNKPQYYFDSFTGLNVPSVPRSQFEVAKEKRLFELVTEGDLDKLKAFISKFKCNCSGE
jgi:hypothetical protein